MLMKFTGQYTGGRNSITICGVTFEGREPADVPDDSRLIGHPEFAEVTKTVTPLVEQPKPRGRPRK